MLNIPKFLILKETPHAFLFFFTGLFMLLLQGCSSTDEKFYPDATPCHSKFINRAYNKPYEIKGNVYVPQTYYNYSETGLASYYGGRDVFHGRPTSNGEIFDKNHITGAHKTIPIPAVVRVTNLDNKRTLLIKINDRGPFIKGRIIDVSEKVSKLLGFHHRGLARVRVETDIPATLKLANTMASQPRKTRSQTAKLPVLVQGTPVHLKTVAKKVYIDVGGFYTLARAKKFVARLKTYGIISRVHPVKHVKGSFFRVLVGPYVSVKQALDAQKKFNRSELKLAKVIHL